MRSDLLLKLADLLDTVPPFRFNYGAWFTVDEDNCERPLVGSCGTTACALGWATTLPELKGQIKIVHIDDDQFGVEAEGGLFGADAAAFVFGLSTERARTLFMCDRLSKSLHNKQGPSAYAEAGEVAQWIRDNVAAWEKEDANAK